MPPWKFNSSDSNECEDDLEFEDSESSDIYTNLNFNADCEEYENSEDFEDVQSYFNLDFDAYL